MRRPVSLGLHTESVHGLLPGCIPECLDIGYVASLTCYCIGVLVQEGPTNNNHLVKPYLSSVDLLLISIQSPPSQEALVLWSTSLRLGDAQQPGFAMTFYDLRGMSAGLCWVVTRFVRLPCMTLVQLCSTTMDAWLRTCLPDGALLQDTHRLCFVTKQSYVLARSAGCPSQAIQLKGLFRSTQSRPGIRRSC